MNSIRYVVWIPTHARVVLRPRIVVHQFPPKVRTYFWVPARTLIAVKLLTLWILLYHLLFLNSMIPGRKGGRMTEPHEYIPSWRITWFMGECPSYFLFLLRIHLFTLRFLERSPSRRSVGVGAGAGAGGIRTRVAQWVGARNSAMQSRSDCVFLARGRPKSSARVRPLF